MKLSRNTLTCEIYNVHDPAKIRHRDLCKNKSAQPWQLRHWFHRICRRFPARNPRVRMAEWLRRFPRYGNASACQRRVGSSPTSDISFGTFSLIFMINCQPLLIDLISEFISMTTPYVVDWQSIDVCNYHHRVVRVSGAGHPAVFTVRVPWNSQGTPWPVNLWHWDLCKNKGAQLWQLRHWFQGICRRFHARNPRVRMAEWLRRFP